MGISSRHVLELVNALHALGLLVGVDEAAERRLELLAARAVGHAAQAGAVPVDLARLGVECALLVGLLLEAGGGANGGGVLGGGAVALGFFFAGLLLGGGLFGSSGGGGGL